jgi:hypothetical protein
VEENKGDKHGWIVLFPHKRKLLSRIRERERERVYDTPQGLSQLQRTSVFRSPFLLKVIIRQMDQNAPMQRQKL